MAPPRRRAAPIQRGTMSDTIVPLRPRQVGLAALSLVLLWPAAINGGPFIFADTPSYLHAADALAVRATGHATAWTNADVRRIAHPPGQRATAARPAPAGAEAAEGAKPVLLGRSIFYAILAYTGVLAGSLWLPLAVQALFVGAVVVGFLRHLVDPADRRRFALAVAGTTAALATTPLAYFTSMLMPDVFTGTTVIAVAALAVGWRRERPSGRAGWIAAASYGALVHSSHVLILLALAAAVLAEAVLARRWRLPPVSWRGALAALLAAGVGLAGEATFSVAVRAMTGEPPIRPPFLTARLVEDGPGVAYLRAHCDPPEFFLCRYRDRLPLQSDSFLWASGRDGVFKTLSPAGQRLLAGEQGRFVWQVAREQPLAVFRSSLSAFRDQIVAWRLPEFNQTRSDAQGIAAHLPPDERRWFVASAAYRREMPTGWVEALVPVWTLVGLAALIAVARDAGRPAGWLYGAVLAGGWIVDLAICGALSTPHDRYQTRVVWLAALWAMAALTSRRRADAAVAAAR